MLTESPQVPTATISDLLARDARLEFRTAVAEAWSAWIDLRDNGGVHPGPCTFTGVCRECRSLLGRCTRHAETLAQRQERLNHAVEALKALMVGDVPGDTANGRLDTGKAQDTPREVVPQLGSGYQPAT